MINFYIYIIGLTLIFSILLLGQQLLFFNCGLFFLGGAAFFSFGAYCSAILSINCGINPSFSIFISSFFTGLLAFITGYLLIKKLKKDYFALATLALAQTTFIILRTLAPGGNSGIAGIPSFNLLSFDSTISPISLFIIIILFSSLCYVLVAKFKKMRLSLLMEASRIDENFTSLMGYSTFKIKCQIFILSGFLGGFAGALQAHYIGAIDPGISSIQQTVLILCGTILSGRKLIIGSLIGALFIVLLPELLQKILVNEIGTDWTSFPLIQILYGILIIIVAFTLFPIKRSNLKIEIGD